MKIIARQKADPKWENFDEYSSKTTCIIHQNHAYSEIETLLAKLKLVVKNSIDLERMWKLEAIDFSL